MYKTESQFSFQLCRLAPSATLSSLQVRSKPSYDHLLEAAEVASPMKCKEGMREGQSGVRSDLEGGVPPCVDFILQGSYKDRNCLHSKEKQAKGCLAVSSSQLY